MVLIYNSIRGLALTYITYIHNFTNYSIIDLVSHSTYGVAYVNFIHQWRDQQYKVVSKRQIF